MKTLPVAAVLAASLTGAPVLAQNPLELAKTQYAAASYEEALSTLARAADDSSARRVEVEQYRAFCLIALGKLPEAERAVAALVEADPQFTPSPNAASPRVLTLVAEMRKKELPAAARRLLDAGRSAFKDKDYAATQEHLRVLLALLEEPGVKEQPEAEDLRVLAEGFMTLASASLAEAEAAAAAPPPAPEPAQPSAPAETEIVTAPVPLQQDVPQWVPPNAAAASREYEGAIRVLIGVDGRVKAASIERPTYPSYDARLLQISRQWLYKPATRNGQPVEAERVIPIQLRPRS